MTGYGADALPRPHGGALGHAVLKGAAEDFRVTERLSFEPSGSGEHLYLQVRKRGLNTDAAAKVLARWLDVAPRDVGYAGLKDRHAVTTQWFSVPTPMGVAVGQQPAEGLEVVAVTRNERKLRRGALRGNAFGILLRAVSAPRAGVDRRLARIVRLGVPNYFGAQRFGRDEGNLERAAAMLAGRLRERSRHRRGLYLSAARSFLFNQVLAQRVVDGSWDRALDGEVVMLDGSHSVFPAADETEEWLRWRLAAGAIHPTGPLPGKDGPEPGGEAAELETRALAPYAGLTEGLSRFGAKGMRRALRLPVLDLGWHWPDAQSLDLSFELPAGSFATTVISEVLTVNDERGQGTAG